MDFQPISFTQPVDPTTEALLALDPQWSQCSAMIAVAMIAVAICWRYAGEAHFRSRWAQGADGADSFADPWGFVGICWDLLGW